MAIRTIFTRGYGNGTFSGTIPLVVTRGYAIAEPAVGPDRICAGAETLTGPYGASESLAGPYGFAESLTGPYGTSETIECDCP